ncbi:MAG: SDR family NAD(P)-dependent oxidoreductase, partial [Anaerolineae bacterium]
MKLEGKTAVVTGGARRLGRAMALALASRGVRVAVHYAQSREQAEETVSMAIELGTEAISLQADLSQEDPAHRVIAQAADQFGIVDILMNNAALFEPGGFAQTTSEDWDRHFSVNLKAPFLLSQDFAAQVPTDRKGKIVNLGDWRGLRPGRDHFAYTIAKAALVGLTEATALALAPNIQVNCLALGA